MSKNQEFVKFDKVDKSYDGKVLVVKDLNLDISFKQFLIENGIVDIVYYESLCLSL